MIILCDIDNVVNNLTETILKIYNEESDDILTKEDITEYYIENFVKPQYKENFHEYFLRKEVWKKCELIPDCQKYISKLFNDGHDIYFCTATEMKNAPKKESYLQRTFPYINIRKKLIVCQNKKMIKADLLIDDCLNNFGGQPYGIILDYAWNRNGADKIECEWHRANNWEEIYQEVCKLDEYLKRSQG